jgi:hypothetical protein
MKSKASFYFSLPRLLCRLFGCASDRSEDNSLEAHAGSVIIFTITYFFLVDLVRAQFSGWKILPALVIAVLAVFLFWVVAFYLNSFLIRALHLVGFFCETPNRHLQGVLAGILITLFSIQLLISNSWMRWAGLLWLIFAILNLIATAVLRSIESGPRGATGSSN